MGNAEFLSGVAFVAAMWAACASTIAVMMSVGLKSTLDEIRRGQDRQVTAPVPPEVQMPESPPRVFHRRRAAHDASTTPEGLGKDEWPEVDGDKNWLSYG